MNDKTIEQKANSHQLSAISYDRGIAAWLITGCVLIWAMVVIGGITRLTHSGLSMTTWSAFGKFPPHTDSQWNEEFANYKKSPEYKQLNSYFALDDFKSIYRWEFIHRSIGRLLGFVFIVPFIWFLIKKRIKKPLFIKCLIIFCLGGLQGLLGWYMVKSGLINEPHVSHFRLAAHLSTALLTFGFTFWVLLDLMYPTNNDSIISLKDTRLNDIVGQAKSAKETAIQHSTFNIQHLSLVLLVFVGIQIIYGAFTSGLHAGQFDPTFPKMGNSWIAPEVFSLNPWWDNFLYNPAGVQFIHRYNAYIVVTLVFIIVYKSKKIEMGQSQKRGLNFLMFMVLIQFLLGVFTLVYSVPVVLGVLHQTGAFMLFSSVLYLLHQLKQLTIHN